MVLMGFSRSFSRRRGPVDSIKGDGSGRERDITVEVEAPRTPPPSLKEDVLFVALGKDEKESQSILMWAKHKSGGKIICILHVHQPADKIPTELGTFPINRLQEPRVRAYHEAERQKMLEILDKYVLACQLAGVQVEKLWKEHISIEKGIVELILENGVKWLVMGAAANKSYSKNMKEPKSKKACFVLQEAPSFCHIWFVCKGNLIFTRASKSIRNTMDVGSPKLPRSLSSSPSMLGSPSAPRCSSFLSSEPTLPNNSFLGVSPQTPLIPDPKFDFERRSPKGPPVVSSSKIFGDMSPISDGPGLQMLHRNAPLEASMGDLYNSLDQIVAETEARKEANQELVKHKKAERDVIAAMHRAKTAQALHAEELIRRKEIEEALSRGTKEAEKARFQLDEVIATLRRAQEQRLKLENQIVESDRKVEELKQKLFSAVGLLQKIKQEKDELQGERDDALKEVEELRKKQSEASSSSRSQFFLEFSFSEIKEATNNFSPSLKIGEGGYGRIFLGNLRHTQVAIKMLKPGSSQGPFEFQQEVNALSKLRHPNIVTLIGACPEALAVIYEYVPNGSLEDHLTFKGNTPPLSWKSRIRISIELCSALVFMHSCLPQGVVHGDVKPGNILLDASYVSKLSYFGTCQDLPQEKCFGSNTMRCFTEDQAIGSPGYIDPLYVQRGEELIFCSDVDAFGVILLRLLTGMPAEGIIRKVETALKNGNLRDVLDTMAGDWPFVQAEQLARLAIRCTDTERRNCPNLALEVWRVLEPMKASCGASSSLPLGSDERGQTQIPSYFVCPIFQEIMQDPVVAADGFTYESEALKGWLESGKDTSPMTSIALPHSDLVQNHALRSAIQEWLQRS